MSDPQRSAFDIILQVLGDAQDILRAEVQLALAQLREEFLDCRAGAQWFGVGILSALLAVFFALVALVMLLSYVLRPWAAALIVALALAICAAFMLRSGSGRLKRLASLGKHRVEFHQEP
ncbi:MAG: phage holin family protein [Steroidobacteraceae bacterium]